MSFARIYEHHVIVKNPSEEKLRVLRSLIDEHTEAAMLIIGNLYNRKNIQVGYMLSTKIPPLEFDPSTMIPQPKGFVVKWKIDGNKRHFLHFRF